MDVTHALTLGSHSKSCDKGENMKGRPKPFKFLDMWTKHEEFLDVVKEDWNIKVEGNPMYQVVKMNSLAQFIRWIIEYISSPKFSIQINGSPAKSFMVTFVLFQNARICLSHLIITDDLMIFSKADAQSLVAKNGVK